MKLTPLLLTASLAGNAALAGFLLTRPAAPASAPVPSASAAALRNAAAPAADKSSDGLRTALAAGDVAALEKAGIAPDVARQIVLGRALARYAEKMRALQPAGTDGKWWKSGTASGANREAILALRREFGEAVAALLGDDLPGFNNDSTSLAFLSAEKRAALRGIMQDYAEMEAKFGAAGGLQLPSDREKLRLLRAERDRDIARLLSPTELAEYELRTSPSAAAVRSRYGEGLESEEEFRRIVALQKAFDERFPREAMNGRVTPELLQQRAAAERQLQADIRAAVGDERYAALRRASDADLRAVDALAARLNLPAGTSDSVATLRESYAAQSQRISNDPNLSPPQRREQIQALGTQARAAVAQALGGEAGETYAQRAPWLSMLNGGIAYSTTPTDASTGALAAGGLTPGVYPILSAGTPGGAPGAVRQVVNIVNTGGPNDGGGMFFAPATRVIDNTQVISVSNSSGTPAPAAGAPAQGAATGGGTSPRP